MRTARSSFLFFFLLTSLFSGWHMPDALGQDDGVALFSKRLSDWRDAIVELQLLRQEYYLAGTLDEANEIRKKYDAAKATGNEKIKELKLAAAQAFREKPREGTDYHNFLLNCLIFDLEQTEDQTMAYELAKALNTRPITRPDVARRVGMSHFLNSDFDTAAKLMKYATSGNDDGMGTLKPYLDLIPRLKPLWAEEVKRREKDKTAKLPRAVVTTTKGKFVIELFEDEAPNLVKNFVKLAQQGFFDDMAFFNVMPFQFAASGSPNASFSGSPGYFLKNEALDPTKRRGNFRGTICAPATKENGNPYVAGSIFMIMFGPYSVANTSMYCNFGRVIDGMDVVDSINRSHGMDGKQVEGFKPDKILKIEVQNLRDHDYEPEIIRPE